MGYKFILQLVKNDCVCVAGVCNISFNYLSLISVMCIFVLCMSVCLYVCAYDNLDTGFQPNEGQHQEYHPTVDY